LSGRAARERRRCGVHCAAIGSDVFVAARLLADAPVYCVGLFAFDTPELTAAAWLPR
jgi:hypothetical protein